MAGDRLHNVAAAPIAAGSDDDDNGRDAERNPHTALHRQARWSLAGERETDFQQTLSKPVDRFKRAVPRKARLANANVSRDEMLAHGRPPRAGAPFAASLADVSWGVADWDDSVGLISASVASAQSGLSLDTVKRARALVAQWSTDVC